MAELGRAALLVTLGLSLYALVAGGAAAALGRRRLALSARNALVASFFSTLVAALVLVAGFLRDDFSLAYVAGHSSRALPLAYKISAFWGGQEGSLLLWLLILTGYAALAVWLARQRARDLVVWVTPVLGGIAVGFTWLLVAVSSPFDTVPAPADGNGLNPSLQNPYMVAHPVLLYLGYVGLAVPFAFAMGALLSGRTDERWIVATRRWTIVAWTALGVGQLLGRALGVPGGRLGRLLRLGPRRERRVDALAGRDRVPPLSDDPGEARHAPGLERDARQPRVLPLAVRDVPHPLGRGQLDPFVHSERDRPVVPRLHRRRGRLLGDDDLAAVAAASHHGAARVARLAGGDVPLQQPPARRAVPDDPLGHRMADPLRGRARRVGRRRASRTTTSSCASSGCRCSC